MIQNKLKATIRDVANFPKEGIVFKDITPVFADAKLCSAIVDELITKYKGQKIDAIAGIESRGFFFGFLLANTLGVPFIPIRKAGKLPFKTVSIEYALEYGTAKIEMNSDAITDGMNVLIHDDLLATGGTAAAAAELITRQGGKIAGFGFVINLAFLEGSKNLYKFSDNIFEIISYNGKGDIVEKKEEGKLYSCTDKDMTVVIMCTGKGLTENRFAGVVIESNHYEISTGYYSNDWLWHEDEFKPYDKDVIINNKNHKAYGYAAYASVK